MTQSQIIRIYSPPRVTVWLLSEVRLKKKSTIQMDGTFYMVTRGRIVASLAMLVLLRKFVFPLRCKSNVAELPPLAASLFGHP